MTPSSKLFRAAHLRIAAFVILFAGLAVAARIDHHARWKEAAAAAAQQSADTLAIAPLAPGDSKQYDYQMGRMSGSIGLLLDRIARFVMQLGHGRPLAILVAIISFAAAMVLLVAADKSPT